MIEGSGMMYDIKFRFDSHKNTLHDMWKLTEFIYEHAVYANSDGCWIEENGPEPNVVVNIYNVTEEQCLLIRDYIRTAEWDGPQPVMEQKEMMTNDGLREGGIQAYMEARCGGHQADGAGNARSEGDGRHRPRRPSG